MAMTFLLVLVLVLGGQVVYAFSLDAATKRRRTTGKHPSSSRIRDAVVLLKEETTTVGSGGSSSSRMMKMSTTITENNKRREFLHRAMAAQIVIVPTVVAVPVALVSQPSPAAAATTTTTTTTNNKPPPILPLLTTAKRLHAIPTFAIVDGYGVPFHTYDKDTAGGLGYFFTSYRSAEFVLEDAKAAFAKAKAEERKINNNNVADEKREGEAEEEEDANNNNNGGSEVPDSWGQARIVSIPLDVVMQLTVKKTSSIAQNGQGKRFNTYYQVIPNQEEQNAALRIEDGPRYRERGRVPLFYIDGLQLPFEDDENDNNNKNNEGGSGSSSSSMMTMMNPVYLHVQDLKDEWQRQHPSSNGSILNMPPIKVRELNETFRAMIRPGGKDVSLSNLIFIPSLDNVGMAKAIAAAGGGNSKYRLGEMILTK
jgi:hypothetical protein